MAREITIQNIPLPAPLSNSDMEFSGLAWYQDRLVLLPQYPNRNNNDNLGKLYSIEKSILVSYILKPSTEPVIVDEIPFDDGNLHRSLEGFEGFEAIVFEDDKVFLTIESRSGTPMMGYLVQGEIVGDLGGIVVDQNTIIALPPQTNFSNASDEAMTLINGSIYTFFEDNGKAQNPFPIAHKIRSTDKEPVAIPFPNIEYRVTDATEANADGTFWVTNYFYPGDQHLKAIVDPLAGIYGEGRTHQQFEGVERILKLQIENDTISLTDTAPIQFELPPDGESRNWEGLVCLDGYGFILVTDKFPETILGFLPYSVECTN